VTLVTARLSWWLFALSVDAQIAATLGWQAARSGRARARGGIATATAVAQTRSVRAAARAAVASRGASRARTFARASACAAVGGHVRAATRLASDALIVLTHVAAAVASLRAPLVDALARGWSELRVLAKAASLPAATVAAAISVLAARRAIRGLRTGATFGRCRRATECEKKAEHRSEGVAHGSRS